MAEAKSIMGLTEKEAIYLEWIGRGLTPFQAAQKAGYSSPSTAVLDLNSRPHIQTGIAELRTKYEEEAKVSRREVIEGIKESIDMARDMSDPQTMIVGWRELGRICGYYETKTKIDISVNGHVQISKLEQMSDQDLLRIIEGEVVSHGS
jgi:hypothetical protein